MLLFYLRAARISAELPQTTSTRNGEAADINLLNVPITENNIKTDGSVFAQIGLTLCFPKKLAFGISEIFFKGISVLLLCVFFFL